MGSLPGSPRRRSLAGSLHKFVKKPSSSGIGESARAGDDERGRATTRSVHSRGDVGENLKHRHPRRRPTAYRGRQSFAQDDGQRLCRRLEQLLQACNYGSSVSLRDEVSRGFTRTRVAAHDDDMLEVLCTSSMACSTRPGSDDARPVSRLRGGWRRSRAASSTGRHSGNWHAPGFQRRRSAHRGLQLWSHSGLGGS